MEEITLRPCVPEDSEFYFNVKKITLKEDVEQTYGVWDEDFQRDRHKKNFSPEHTQIIQFNGNDIGILAIETVEALVWVHNIEILPKYQSKGIGTFLLKNLIQQMISERKSVFLQVFKTNLRAQQFYHRIGFILEPEMETESHFRMKYTL